MDFNLSQDQQFFRETIRSFVDKEIRPVASELEKSGTYPDEIVKKMKDMGLFGILIPEEYGGQNLDMVSMSILFEEISRGWMGIAGILGSHSLSTWMINKHGTEEQKNEFLPKLATGELRTGVGLTEPDAGTDLQGIKTKAVLDGDHYIVNGSKMWITNGRYANPLPVLVKTDTKAEPAHKGMSVLLMDQNAEGFEISKDIGKLGYKGPESCLIMFSDVKVHKSMLLGEVEGRGLQQVLSALEIGRLNIAARAVGIAQESYNQALAYSKERKAFGKEINEFQAIQLKLAELATNVQASRLLTWWSASMADQGKRVDT